MMYSETKLISLVLVGLLLVVSIHGADAIDDHELDSLVSRFSSGLSSVSAKLGVQADSQVNSASDAEEKMRSLYSTLERTLTEARQVAANSRSSLIWSRIEKLSL